VQPGNNRQALDAERVRLLYDNARLSIVGVLLGAIFFSLYHWHHVDRSILLGWIAITLLINLPRLWLVARFQKALGQGDGQGINSMRWENRFYFGVILSSLSWGAVSLFPYEQNLLQNLTYTALLLIVLSSASIVTLITSLKMGLTFLTATTLPIIARCLLIGGEEYLVLALVGLTYYVIFTNLACRLHHTIIDNISLKIENEQLSLRDGLTGLANRRQLQLFSRQLQQNANSENGSYSVVMLDLDKFKAFNDGNGHHAGDTLLSQVAGIITRESRAEDLVVRYGGEEFMMVLPAATLEQAHSVAERVRSQVGADSVVSISAGVACRREAESLEQVTARADQALYCAKALGRDRVVIAQDEENVS